MVWAEMRARLALWLALALALSGCSTMRQALGVPSPGDPSVAIKSAETRWLLIKNPRFGDVASEPEYIWVEEDKIPFTFTGLINKKAIIAPPEIVARYGPPPGGGKISGRQGVPTQAGSRERAGAPSASAATPASVAAAPSRPPGARDGAAAVPEPPRRGMVVYVDTTRIVIDLTAADGIRPGTLVSLRRDKIPIVHPVTGEVLGELDEEIGTARVIQIREKFSVANLEVVASGAQIQIKDRVVPK
jgi:flagellar assembly FlgT-like protein